MNNDKKQEILSIVGAMSAKETEQLFAILNVLGRFENETREVMSPADTKKNAEDWMKEQNPKKYHNTNKHRFILDGIKNRSESVIRKKETEKASIRGKISARREKISFRKDKIKQLEKRINRYYKKIGKLRTGSGFLRKLSGRGKIARFILNSNAKRELKFEKRIERIRKGIEYQNAKINKTAKKIDALETRISKREASIEAQKDKISRINDIIDMDAPYATLTYFLSERAGGINVREMEDAFINPENYFSHGEMNMDNRENLPVKFEEPPIYTTPLATPTETSAATFSVTPETAPPQSIPLSRTDEAQLKLYALFEGVDPSIGFDYKVEDAKVKQVAGAAPVFHGDSNSNDEFANLKNKNSGVLYKEVTAKEIPKLDGLVFIFKRDDEKPENFIIKFNEADKPMFDKALKNAPSAVMRK